MNEKYANILNLPHHVSPKRPQMPAYDRAAQFAPFAALTGYDAAVVETARCTSARRELDEHEKAALDERLRFLAQHLSAKPQVEITYFLPDVKKIGGSYVTASGIIQKIDSLEQELITSDGVHIPFDDMLRLEGALFQERYSR